MTNNDTYFKVELTQALAVGDVISSMTYSRTDAALGLLLSTATSHPGSCSEKLSIAKVGTADYEAFSNYTVQDGDGLVGQTTFYIYRETGKSTYFDEFTITRPATKTATAEALKASAAVKVDDVALTLDAASNGYSISGTTITLSDDITAISAPDNIALVKTITYDDASTKDEDVTVTFDGTITVGYYIGTASIGLTGSEVAYTVRVKQNVTPTAFLSETSGSIAITNSYTVVASKTVTLTGGNLTDGTYDVTADVTGTTISPASFTVSGGSVDQEFTITSTASSAATTVFTFGTSSMGVTAPTYTLTYSKVAQRSLSQADVSELTTWDWSKAYNADVQLTDVTSPKKTDEFLLSNIAEVKNDANFNAQALKVITEYATRKQSSTYMMQGNKVTFHTTVPGNVQVYFSNTGNRGEDTEANKELRRYLVINDENTGVYSLNSTPIVASANVSAGDVVITALLGVTEPAATMVRITKIVFAPTETATISTAKYATYVPTMKVAVPDGVSAYKVSATATEATLTPLTVIPAGVPVVIYKDVDAATEVTFTATAADASDVTGNELQVSATDVTADGTQYVLAKPDGKEIGFYKAESGTTIAADKAYLVSPSGAPCFVFNFDGSATGIEAVEAAKSFDGAFYNLAGQRVSQPTRGLYIVNGKKVVIK